MQQVGSLPLHEQAFEAVFRSLKPIDDDGSTSAGSSDRGSSPVASNGSPCCTGRVPGQRACKPKNSRPWHSKRNKQEQTIQTSTPVLAKPPGLVAPPGLSLPVIAPPPGLEDVWESLQSLSMANPGPPPGLEKEEYSPKTFRKEVTAILRDLASTRNVAAAVRRVRAQNVPMSRQAAEFTDLLTRAAEENRGIARRLSFAFAAGLTAGDASAFNKSECLKGLRKFFSEVYDDLGDEVPRLPVIARCELVPTMQSVMASEILNEVLPMDLKIV